eukprot:COSAG06_NODE_4765_length_3973_cov_118.929014_7_plen_59_part_01
MAPVSLRREVLGERFCWRGSARWHAYGHAALADAYFETITGGSCVDEHADETGVNGVDE